MIVNDIESLKRKLSYIFLSHTQFMLDLRDFVINTKIAIEKFQNERYRGELSRNSRFSLSQIVQWDIERVMEMSLIKIFSMYENFLRVFFVKFLILMRTISITFLGERKM